MEIAAPGTVEWFVADEVHHRHTAGSLPPSPEWVSADWWHHNGEVCAHLHRSIGWLLSQFSWHTPRHRYYKLWRKGRVKRIFHKIERFLHLIKESGQVEIVGWGMVGMFMASGMRILSPSGSYLPQNFYHWPTVLYQWLKNLWQARRSVI